MLQFDILTATIGTKHLSKLLESLNGLIENQEYRINHTIIVDGEKFKEKTNEILSEIPNSKHINRNVIYLPFNTGADGYLANKIYAGFVHLMFGDFIIFLDDDNWVEPEHIENYYNLIKKREKTDWLYCLRKIVDVNDNFICKDLCESLGNIHPCYYNQLIYLIDTNCYCVSREIAVKYSSFWNKKSEDNYLNPDRIYTNLLMKNEKDFECTFKFTINYRVAEKIGRSPIKEVFTRGNDFLLESYGKLIWENEMDIQNNFLVLKGINSEETNKKILQIKNKKIILSDDNGKKELNLENSILLNYYDNIHSNNLLLCEFEK